MTSDVVSKDGIVDCKRAPEAPMCYPFEGCCHGAAVGIGCTSDVSEYPYPDEVDSKPSVDCYAASFEITKRSENPYPLGMTCGHCEGETPPLNLLTP